MGLRELHPLAEAGSSYFGSGHVWADQSVVSMSKMEAPSIVMGSGNLQWLP